MFLRPKKLRCNIGLIGKGDKMNEINYGAIFIGISFWVVVIGLPIYLRSRRRNLKAGPRKITETKCTCQACGNVWYYGGLGDRMQNIGKLQMESADTIGDGANALACCSGCVPAGFIPSSSKAPVRDLHQCQKCNSRAITREKVTHEVS